MDEDVIKRLEIELARLDSVRDRAKRQLRAAENDRRAIVRTIAILKAQSVRNALDVTADEISGMTQEQAVVYIAGRNEGTLRFGAAKRLLLDAGLIGNPKNAAAILYTMIQRSGRFEQVRRGEYRLSDQAAHPRATNQRPIFGSVAFDGRDSDSDMDLDAEPDPDDYEPTLAELADDDSPTLRDLAG